MSTLLMPMFTTTGTAIRTHMSRARSMIIDVTTRSRHQGIKEEAAQAHALLTGNEFRITYTNHKE
ncbi:hypothetical protein BGZ92_000767 [Podila epicladia]|nr:hypothetical protein BGZ92_000767 [Podila epicladia]